MRDKLYELSINPANSMNAKPYLIPAEATVFEEEIKKSHFITYLAHTPSIEEAKAFVDSIKAKHADARHNCWAFVLADQKTQ